MLDSSAGRLFIRVEDTSVTAHRTDKGEAGEEIEIPLYHLAEWIARNWWSLLYEPQKDEDEDKQDFRLRHWFGTARSGFALPDVWVVPTDGHLELRAKSCHLRFSRVAFTESTSATVDTDLVSRVLGTFTENVVNRLTMTGNAETLLHEAWKCITSTPDDAVEFCRLMGSLGLSPYEEHSEVEDLLERLGRVLDGTALRDLCQAATPADFRKNAVTSERIWKAVKDATEKVDITDLAEVSCPEDRTPHAWQWGVEGVKRIRKDLGLKATRDGADEFFHRLNLDPDRNVVAVDSATTSQSVTGGVERHETSLSVAMVDDKDAQRRFTAARAAFLGWISKDSRARLITGARTRDQQASRAFAAELLAPIAYIRSKAKNGILSLRRVDEIAYELQVSPWVVSYQARNNHLSLV